MYGIPMSSLESKPAYSGVSNQAGAATRSKLFTTSTAGPEAFEGIPADSSSDGKLHPPSFHATTFQVYMWPGATGRTALQSSTGTPSSNAPSSIRVYSV